jgi:D-arabinose 1-dehydrogenase-like Zn-dependent alcohol dehydrogenase
VVPGHEAAGTVVAVGGSDEGDRQWVGQRVALYYIDPDRESLALGGKENLGDGVKRMGVDFDGALSQYVTRPIRSLVLGQGLPATELAVLSDAVATPHHALQLADLQPRQTVAIIGIGGIGSNAVQLSSLRGARTIAVGRSETKLAVARSLGADATISSAQGAAAIRETAGGHIDVVLQCVGSAAMDELAIEIAGVGGTVVLIGASSTAFTATSTQFIWRELRLIGSRGFTRQDIEDVIALRLGGELRLDHLLSDVRTFGAAGDAFAEIGVGEGFRTIIEPWVGFNDAEVRAMEGIS